MSTDVPSSSGDEIDSNQSDTECLKPSPAKKRLTVNEKRRSKNRPFTSIRKSNKKWGESFIWLIFDGYFQGAFCKVCRKRGISLRRIGGTWISKPFKSWKKTIEKIKAHVKSDIHIQPCEAEMVAVRALLEGLIIQQLQQIGAQEKLKNRIAIKALIRCTHFLARRHIPHTTKFDELIGLIASCGAEDLKRFLERAGKNPTYKFNIVVEFVEAVGLCAEECLLKRLHQVSNFSIMADECTEVTTIEELSIFYHWVQDEKLVEHFLEYFP
ncbi:Zinc finger MYM-type protein 1-like [Oopsacas minuta]|uniref:Zinc finger MYM-type protein 1-like n=1 Tax=Oopsacas minuta TaxID=111878 RepID=A0AAV7JMS4_9METZ|nr:Zinc finger MYM-type protein 1-like [Oopsacas minuta]